MSPLMLKAALAKAAFFVIPAEEGIQLFQHILDSYLPESNMTINSLSGRDASWYAGEGTLWQVGKLRQ